MTTHRNCTHPATSSARAKCRKQRAAEDALLAPTPDMIADRERLAAQEAWYAFCETLPEAVALSASANADDTSLEEGFEVDSLAWFECATMTAQRILDTTPDEGV